MSDTITVDDLQMARSGGVTLVSTDKKEATASIEVAGKFALFIDLGVITVPDDYDHADSLEMFGKKNRKKFSYYNSGITDPNFTNPTRILKPGDKLRVRVFKQIIGGTTSSEDRLTFLASQKAVYAGAQGASLVYEQKRDQLPKDELYMSFDEKKHLWRDANGDHRVPGLGVNSSGRFRFVLGYFADVWDDGYPMLCFNGPPEAKSS